MLTILLTSARVAPGLLSWQAWAALREANRVLAGRGHPQLPALAEAGIAAEAVDEPADAAGLAALLLGALRRGAREAERAPASGASSGPGEPQGPERSDGVLQAQPGGTAPSPGGQGGLGGLVGIPPGNSVAWLAPAGEEAPPSLLAALSAAGIPGGVRVLPGSRDVPGAHLIDVVATMDTLRVSCPWDRKQTHASLAPHLLEEPYEALEALENGDHQAFREELGDVLLQVAFHARIAAERPAAEGGYTIDDVADTLVAKLVRRHPHVFAGVTARSADDVTRNWDEIKKAERAAKNGSAAQAPPSVLDGVAFGQPALSLAAQVLRRAARAGFPGEAAGGDGPGEELLRLVARTVERGADPETELRTAVRRLAAAVRDWELRQP